MERLEDRCLLATLTQSLFPDPTGPQQGANFGYAVATDSNYRIVGSPYEDVGGVSDSGAAYVYDAATGALIVTLSNPSPAAGDYFGSSVSVSGNTVVVGAYADDSGAVDGGQAYVFDATTGALIATLANPSPAASDLFGYSVSVSGNTAVVGAIYDDTGASNSGQAYVFNATTGALIATLANPSPAGDDNFGYSVSVSGNTVVVGSLRDDTGAGDSGQAYVFNATTGALITNLANPSPAAGDYFGISVSVSGNTAVVGAHGDDTGAGDSGQAYVFNATTGGLITTLSNPSPAAGDNFGISVSVSGNTVAVGAYLDDTGASNSGQAYAFNATTGELLTILANPSPTGGDSFGYSVSVSGNKVVVGAYGDDFGANDSGQAYQFDVTVNALVATLANPSPATNYAFGFSVATDGTFNVVGAPGADIGGFIV